MSMQIDPIQPQFAPLSAPGAAAGLRATAGRVFSEAYAGPAAEAATPVTELAPGDLPEVAIDAVRTAARAYEQLRATGRELRFASTEVGLRIEVYDGSGHLVRRIPPNEALALAAEEATWLA
jgi:hypothetical protein